MRTTRRAAKRQPTVSVLFNEPKLLKCPRCGYSRIRKTNGFSALQRAEIAEIVDPILKHLRHLRFSALQRAEIAEIERRRLARPLQRRFSALQRAEIAEIEQRAQMRRALVHEFQCSSTSRNC